METKAILDRFGQLKSQRDVWDTQYQVIGEYISQSKQNFTDSHSAGEFLNDFIYDSTGTFAANSASSTMLGMLWGGSAKQAIEIMPPDDLVLDAELSNFYENMSKRAVKAMDDPKANLMVALGEYMQDQLVFCTSGIGVERGKKSKLKYKAYGVQQAWLVEGEGGDVEEIWLNYNWTLNRVAGEYGVDNLSEELRKKYEKGDTSERVDILHVIRPRDKPKAKKGALSMPYESLHIEQESGNLLKESGYDEKPIFFVRFRKLLYETYGRGAGFDALPDIKEANETREALIIATRKTLNMPKGVFHDGIMGGGVIDTSENAITVFNSVGVSGNPIFDIGSPPDLRGAQERMIELRESISQHFGLDRLLDFNNSQQMTLGEAQMRNQIRMRSMANPFARQISEGLNPMVERSVNLLFRMGEFGVIRGSEEEQERIASGLTVEYLPERIVQRLERGEPIYEVGYKTQATQAARAEEYIAIMEAVDFAMRAAQADPSVLDNIDLDEAMRVILEVKSITSSISRSEDEVKELREQRQAQIEQQQQMEQLQQGASIAKDVEGYVNE